MARFRSLAASLAALAALAALTGLAACQERAAEPVIEANDATEPAPPPVMEPLAPAPAEPAEAPPPPPANVSAAVEDEPEIVPPDVQMQEDAEATGMTSRLPAETDGEVTAVPATGGNMVE